MVTLVALTRDLSGIGGSEMNLKVEVIGVSPPCPRCKKTEENATKAAAKIAAEGVKVEVAKLDVTAKESISKYGVLVTACNRN